jgi:hypothetical protein
MRFGVREICDIIFRPLTSIDIGNQHFDAGQPVLYIDTATTSSLEGAATTVYARGGKGNPRLIGWDGEKELTFTFEDALMSPVSFSMLSGAGVVKGVGANDNADEEANNQKVYVHQMYDLVVEKYNDTFFARLPQETRDGVKLIATKEAPIYATILDSAGAQKYFLSAIAAGEIFKDGTTEKMTYGPRGVMEVEANEDIYFKLTSPLNDYDETSHEGHISVQEYGKLKAGDAVRIDCYAVFGEGAQEIQIDAESFAGYYYIEASTLFRDEATGADFPAEFVIPRAKIQSNFTFTMAASGDPSTFTFTIDCFPAYTKFNKGKKVLASLQIVDPTAAKHNYADKKVVGHDERTADEDEYYTGLYKPEGSNDPMSIFTQLGE